MHAPAPARLPVSTYRLQLSAGFTFADAAALAPYLSALGVGTCYCSPILAARHGTAHGYDVTDHSRINPELGGEDQLRAFAAALHEHGLGLLVDLVPNHMSTDPAANHWWRSVLENGPSSPFARYFDIDWAPVKDELLGKVLLPVLGDQYGVTLDRGELQVELRDGAFALRYHDLDLPLNPRSLRPLLQHNLDALAEALGPNHPQLVEFQSVLFHLEHLPLYTDTRDAMMALRQREKEVAKHRLAELFRSSAAVRQHVEANVRLFNGTPGDSDSFDLLHAVLERQAYRLSSWRTAMHEINYRRFFDVNELAGIRVEDPAVFDGVHAVIRALAAEGVIDGVRLDHVDGLFDPSGYFEQLVASTSARPIYIVAEKILSAGEPLRADWAIHGTTGYDFANDVNGLFVDGRRAGEMQRLYERFTGRQERFADVVYESKKLVIATSMSSELNVLAHELNRISESHRSFRDFTQDSLKEAMREVVACFPVYRTYVSPAGWSAFGETSVDTAVAEALARNPATEPSIFRFIRQMLLPVQEPGVPVDEHRRRVRFAMTFQQYTGPVQAKGVEDTAFYRYAPLLSLNEVGGDPARFGAAPEVFHRANLHRLRHWPLTMLASSTHDSKRGEDARARINLLSEIPGEWRTAVSRWAHANASAKTLVRGRPAPSRADEYFFYQTLVGVWPAEATTPVDETFVGRLRGYMEKAVKEAKRHTSWINPAPEYDEAMARFVERVLTGANARAFLRRVVPFVERLAALGAVNALAQLVLRVGSPGVPDVYRGSELWDLALVDPDNRGPVDFERRRAWLEAMLPLLDGTASAAARRDAVADMVVNWRDGRIKLYTTAAALRLRRRWPDLFVHGDYEPLGAAGPAADHLVGFVRRLEGRTVLVLAPRLVATLAGGQQGTLVAGADAWKDTVIRLPDASRALAYTDALTGERVPLHDSDGGPALAAADVFRIMPVSLLVGDRREGHES